MHNDHVVRYFATMADQSEAEGFETAATYWQMKWEGEPSTFERYDTDGNIV